MGWARSEYHPQATRRVRHDSFATEGPMRRFSGEPDLAEILTDPIVQALMRADGCDLRSLYESLDALREDDARPEAAD
jgi:hypothetical protein